MKTLILLVACLLGSVSVMADEIKPIVVVGGDTAPICWMSGTVLICH